MESQQIVDYIATNIKNGYTETNLRKHLKNNGWERVAINDAFKRYHAARRLNPTTRAKRRPSRQDRLKNRAMTFAAAVMIVAVAFGVIHFWPKAAEPQTAKAAPALSYSQKQVLDVNTIGGAIGQYTAANGGVLPSRLTIGSSTNALVMCNTICDPTTSQISSLLIYKPEDVKLMSYVADLAAPDEQALYLVKGATCKNPTTLGGPSSTPRSMVILYAAASGSALTQRCITL
jgi:hypothetical protein